MTITIYCLDDNYNTVGTDIEKAVIQNETEIKSLVEKNWTKREKERYAFFYNVLNKDGKVEKFSVPIDMDDCD